MALVKFVNFGQAKILAQQIGHRALLEPLPVQPPFAARSDQATGAERLQNQIPARAFAAGRQMIGPELAQAQFLVELAEEPAGAHGRGRRSCSSESLMRTSWASSATTRSSGKSATVRGWA